MIRLGIIGTGDIAHIHIIGLLTSNNYEIAGCYSPENREAMIFARQYRLISYSSANALIKYVDAIDITDNLPETMALAELAIKELKHVFIAQPFQLYMKQMQYLKKLAEESGVVLQLGTGYKYCPVYHLLAETMQTAMLVDVRRQLAKNSDLNSQLFMQLTYDFDFVTSILNTSITKLDIKTWVTNANSPDVLNCRLECDNSSVINIVAYTIVDGDPELEMTYTSSDTIIRADVFQSIVEKQYRTSTDKARIILDVYNEKSVHQYFLKNFYRAICNEHDAIRKIEKQFQNIAAADYVVEKLAL